RRHTSSYGDWSSDVCSSDLSSFLRHWSFVIRHSAAGREPMTFLQPLLLVALPLVALPVIIHLINQRRYQTIRWAAMIFLLAANQIGRASCREGVWIEALAGM